MIRLLPLLMLLAACGVDGPPVRPSDAAPREQAEPASNLLVTGSAGIGVAGTF